MLNIYLSKYLQCNYVSHINNIIIIVIIIMVIIIIIFTVLLDNNAQRAILNIKKACRVRAGAGWKSTFDFVVTYFHSSAAFTYVSLSPLFCVDKPLSSAY